VTTKSSEVLLYGEEDLAPRVRKLIEMRQKFSIAVDGEAFRELLPLVVDGQVSDLSKMGLQPKLRLLLGLMLTAMGQEQDVRLQPEKDRILVWVGG
jgi:hypothetical protein